MYGLQYVFYVFFMRAYCTSHAVEECAATLHQPLDEKWLSLFNLIFNTLCCYSQMICETYVQHKTSSHPRFFLIMLYISIFEGKNKKQLGLHFWTSANVNSVEFIFYLALIFCS